VSYLIKLTNGNILTQIPDTQLVTSFGGLQLIGKDFPGFGTSLNTDLVHMVENFASSTPPANPFVGQLWYDTVGNEINFWNGTVFKSISVITTSDVAPINPQQEGDEWYNTITQQLFIWTGTQWLLIGPPAPLGGKEGFVVASIGNPPVYYLQLYANNVLLGVVSAVNMINPGIAGFGNIRVGFNFPINPESAPAINPAGLFNMDQITIGDGDQIAITLDPYDNANLAINGNVVLVASSDPAGTGNAAFAQAGWAAGAIVGSIYANTITADSFIGLPSFAVPGTFGEALLSKGDGANLTVSPGLTVIGNVVTANALVVNNTAQVGGLLTAQAVTVTQNLIVDQNGQIDGLLNVTGNVNAGKASSLFIPTVNNLTVVGTSTLVGEVNTEGTVIFNFGSGGFFALPTNHGVAGEFLVTNADGTTAWANASIPGGNVGDMLISDGTKFVPRTRSVSTNLAGVGTRTNGGAAMQNTSAGDMIVSGAIACTGSGVGTCHGQIGPTSGSLFDIWNCVFTATVDNASAAFYMVVPQGWWYRAFGDGAVNRGINTWYETIWV